MLKIGNLSKKINEKNILRNISLQVGYGEIAVFLGASGVGKSTLLRILSNLESFNSGFITLDGKTLDLKRVNVDHIVGMLSQHFDLFEHLTAEENITLGLEKLLGKSKKEASRIANELLNHYGLGALANSYPSQLSGGQKQRLAIARMISLKPKIICFDEPTSALDPILTNFVANAIKELANEGYIVLVATHDTMLLKGLPCVINLMQAGEIVQSAKSAGFWENRKQFSLINSFITGEIV